MNKYKKRIIRAVTVDESLEFIEPLLPNLQKEYEIQLLSSPGEYLKEICERNGLKGHSIFMSRRISISKDINALLQLIKLFYQEKPYLVHSMTPKAGLLCMIAAWITRVPLRIHTFTGLVWPTANGFLKKILMCTDWVTCKCATHIIPEGKGVQNDLQEHITSKPMKVLGYGNIRGIDTNRFSLRPEVMSIAEKIRGKDVFTFLYVGRLVSDKGINELISAFDRLCLQHTHLRLLLVGYYETEIDPLKEETLKIINRNPSIEYVGPQTGDQLIGCYAASDCFVFPSYREGFPNTVLEAGAMGIPCIVTDINGSREIIENGVNGLIIPPQNDIALYEAMKHLLHNTDERKRMAMNARPIIESKFDQHFVEKCLSNFYHEIIQHKQQS